MKRVQLDAMRKNACVSTPVIQYTNRMDGRSLFLTIFFRLSLHQIVGEKGYRMGCRSLSAYINLVHFLLDNALATLRSALALCGQKCTRLI